MKDGWRRFLWALLPEEARARLSYTEELARNLFVALPPVTKHRFISHAQELLRYPTFVETGTFVGDTTFFASGLFSRVHSIELSPDLALRAAERFATLTHVTIHQGDSSQVLHDLLPTIQMPCLFWLDGHYSGGITARGQEDTPILGELAAIRRHAIRPSAILIDDARVFGVDDAYPTLEEVFCALREIDASFRIGVSSDIIWAAPIRLLRFQWRTSVSGVIVAPSTT